MHGVKRARQSAEAIALRKEKEQAKLKTYLALTESVLNKKKDKDWSPEAFDLTTELLETNPEFYTIWNYRRDILRNRTFPASTPEQISSILTSELHLTTVALKHHPKVYWIWNHRRWCLENTPDGPEDSTKWKKEAWDGELYVVERLLDADARNFQAWNYRRYVLASMPVPRSLASEIDYTTKKIASNFSNFSAWHQRSKVLTAMWDKGELDPVKTKEEEFDLIRNAMYTDPEDQSVWVYQRWLVGNDASLELLQREIDAIQELLDVEPDSKWCMESLVYYKQQLLQNHRAQVDAPALTAECVSLLGRLRTVDPSRKMRYAEIEQELEQAAH